MLGYVHTPLQSITCPLGVTDYKYKIIGYHNGSVRYREVTVQREQCTHTRVLMNAGNVSTEALRLTL